MKQLVYTGVALVALAVPAMAQAQETSGHDWRSGLYVKGAGVLNYARDHDFSTVSGGIESELDAGGGVSAAIGYDYGQVRAETEIAYRTNDVDSHNLAGTGPLASPNGDVQSLAFMVNGYYDFDLNAPLTPYVGSGVGIANVDFQDYGAGTTAAMSGDETVFAYQAIVGLEYEFVDHLSALAEYRYFATSDVDVEATLGSNRNSDTSYANHSVLLGLKYAFY